MSWNKNTVDCSHIDSIVTTLQQLGVPYSLSVMKELVGWGLNDDIPSTAAPFSVERLFPIRRLEYKRFVLLERMERTTDCDTDDLLCSYPFDFEDEPADWKYEITEENS